MYRCATNKNKPNLVTLYSPFDSVVSTKYTLFIACAWPHLFCYSYLFACVYWLGFFSLLFCPLLLIDKLIFTYIHDNKHALLDIVLVCMDIYFQSLHLASIHVVFMRTLVKMKVATLDICQLNCFQELKKQLSSK